MNRRTPLLGGQDEGSSLPSREGRGRSSEENRWKRERRGGDGFKCSKMGPFLRRPLSSPPQPSAVPTKIRAVLGRSGVSMKIGEKVKSFIWTDRK